MSNFKSSKHYFRKKNVIWIYPKFYWFLYAKYVLCSKSMVLSQILHQNPLEVTLTMRRWQIINKAKKSLWTKLVEVTEFQLSYSKSWKTMLWKCCTQYASKFGKLSRGHRTGKGQFSFQSQRKAMPKNAQTTAQLHSSHMLVK